MRNSGDSNIVDAFLAFDEVELIRLRIDYLSDVVDVTYLAESQFTFSGKPKPLFLRQNLAHELKNRTDIRFLEIPISEDLLARGSAWEMEAFHRQWLCNYLAREHPDDLVVISDADEIPSREQLLQGRKLANAASCIGLPMKTIIRRANWRERPLVKPLMKVKVVTGKRLNRYSRGSLCLPAFAPQGIHFSYAATDSEKLERKYSSFSHTELDDRRFSSEGILEFAEQEMIHHAGRAEKLGSGVLVNEGLKQLNGFQRLALERHPDWFDFKSRRPSWLRQVRSSQVLSDYLFRNQRFPDSQVVEDGAWRSETLSRYIFSRLRWLARTVRSSLLAARLWESPGND